MAIRSRFVTVGTLLLLSGCSGPGVLYTDIVMPYTRDMDRTPVATRSFSIDEYRIREPLSGYGITALWQNGEVQAAARDAGVSSIRYADRRTFSILGGIYRKRTLIIYGD